MNSEGRRIGHELLIQDTVFSVAPIEIDQSTGKTAGGDAADVLGDLAPRRARRRVAGDVGRQVHFRMVPEGAVGGQRLGAEDIERSPRDGS